MHRVICRARVRRGCAPAVLRAALRGNQEETRRFYLAQDGIIPLQEFFNPDNLERLIQSNVITRNTPLPYNAANAREVS